MAVKSNIKGFSVCTLNCEGARRSQDFIAEYLSLNRPDILCLQETWLLDSNLSLVNSIHPDYLSIGKSGVDSSREILVGRPSGGVSIMYHKSIARHVKTVASDNRRVCGVLVTLVNNCTMLILCVYFPCDSYSMSSPSDDFVELINDVEQCLHSVPCDDILICGDFNASLERRNAHTAHLLSFVGRNSMKPCWESPVAVPSPTYVNHALCHSSTIDHVMLSKNLFANMKRCQVHYDPRNPSNHNVLEVALSVECAPNAAPQSTSARQPSNRRNWRKATEGETFSYKIALDEYLNMIVLDNDALRCANTCCIELSHRQTIDNLCQNIVESCLTAGRRCIPGKYQFRQLPGWKELVKPERDNSLFWHWIWLECGRPNVGAVYECMKRTRHRRCEESEE